MANQAVKNTLFVWEGKNKTGQTVKGIQNAPSEAVIRALLRRQGISPTAIKKQSGRAASKRRQKIRPVDIAIFSRQLATMIGAGVPLVQALEIVARGNDNVGMRELIMNIRSSIEGGSSLSEALAAHPAQFDDLFVNLVGAGEKSGALETLLDKIATYKEKSEAIKAKDKLLEELKAKLKKSEEREKELVSKAQFDRVVKELQEAGELDSALKG